jgi:hypothetical protein
MTGWPFTDPLNVATVTVRQIMDRQRPILLVCHDEEDGRWQFLTGDEVRMEDALLVTLHSVVELDSSLFELADLPAGWTARREHPRARWIRQET